MDFSQAVQASLKIFLADMRDGLMCACSDVVMSLSDRQVLDLLLEAKQVPQCAGALNEYYAGNTFWSAARFYLMNAIYEFIVVNPYLKFWADVTNVVDLTWMEELPSTVEEYFTMFTVYKTPEGEVPMTTERAAMAVLQGWAWEGDELHQLFGELFQAPCSVQFPPDGSLYQGRSEPGLYVAVAYGVSQILLRDPDIAAEEAARLAG